MGAARGRNSLSPEPSAMTQSERIADLRWRLWWVTRERLPDDVIVTAQRDLDRAEGRRRRSTSVSTP